MTLSNQTKVAAHNHKVQSGREYADKDFRAGVAWERGRRTQEDKSLSATKETGDDELTQARGLLIELAMRTNTAFPRDEWQEECFRERLICQHEFHARLNRYLNKIC